jgi:electron transfer flavoprotein alpha subunit
MAEILVFCDKEEVAFELLSWTREFSQELGLKPTATILGTEGKAEDYFAYGAEKVYISRDEKLSAFNAETYAEALVQISQGYDGELLLLGSTKKGKELAPRVAQKLAAGCVTDAIGVEVKDRNLLVSRYALGGNTISSAFIKTPKKVIAVMPKVFKLGAKKPEPGEVITVDLKLKEPSVKIIERREKTAESVDLESAESLVCVGRGLAKKEDLELIQELAKALNAEIGCTKSLTDYQWLSEERLVGLSGKKCKPQLYVSIGISGQIQHVVGVRESKIIVAINKDKNAPIFKVADYGIVGDLYQIVPKLVDKIKYTKG